MEHVSDVAFLMPVQMSGSTWMGEGETERSTSATGGSSSRCVVKQPAHAGGRVGEGPACVCVCVGDAPRWCLPAEASTFPHVNVLLAASCYWKQLQTPFQALSGTRVCVSVWPLGGPALSRSRHLERCVCALPRPGEK